MRKTLIAIIIVVGSASLWIANANTRHSLPDVVGESPAGRVQTQSQEPTNPSTEKGSNSDRAECSGFVDHVLLEEGNVRPFPEHIIPDVGSMSEVPWAEWNYLNQHATTRPDITAHCYSTRDESKSIDVTIPRTIKKCVFKDNRFSCE